MGAQEHGDVDRKCSPGGRVNKGGAWSATAAQAQLHTLFSWGEEQKPTQQPWLSPLQANSRVSCLQFFMLGNTVSESKHAIQ